VRKLLVMGAFAVVTVASGLVPSAVSAAPTILSTTPTTVPHVSPGGGTSGIHPDVSIIEYCPIPVTGAFCGYTGVVSRGQYTDTWTYIFDETYQTMRGVRSCSSATCSIQNCGQGLFADPISWTVSGNNAFFTSITPYCP
jgi:hypothetical protein